MKRQPSQRSGKSDATLEKPNGTAERPLVEAVPTRIGAYEIRQEIGRGATGTVYLATPSESQSRIAVKVLAPRLVSDRSRLQQFQVELNAIEKLEHDNVVSTIDSAQSDGVFYIATPYIEGISLEDLLAKVKRLPTGAACEIVRQVAEGLQHIHENQLQHRDIKPSNVMITAQGQVKLIDVGVAILRGNESADQHTSIERMGTPDFMAPEQVRVDIRADLYSLGCTLYTLLGGRPPFASEEHSTRSDKLVAHAHEQPEELTSLCRSLPISVAEVVATMMAKAPDDRPATPADVVEQLRPWSDSIQLTEFVRRALDPAGDISTRTWGANLKVPEYSNWAGVGIAVALLFLGVGWLLFQESGSQERTSESPDRSPPIDRVSHQPTNDPPRPSRPAANEKRTAREAEPAEAAPSSDSASDFAMRLNSLGSGLPHHQTRDNRPGMAPPPGLASLSSRRGRPRPTSSIAEPGTGQRNIGAGDAGTATSVRAGTWGPLIDAAVLRDNAMRREDSETLDSAQEALIGRGETLGTPSESKSGGVRHAIESIQAPAALLTPKTAGDHYHNACVYIEKGDYPKARQAFLDYFATTELQLVDPHLRFVEFLKRESASEKERDVVLALPGPNAPARELALALLESPPKRTTRLRSIVELNPEFAPALYFLSQEYSRVNLGDQTFGEIREEKRCLKRFLELSDQDDLLRHFLDQREALRLLDEANARLTRNSELVERSVLEKPVTFPVVRPSARKSWMFVVNIHEPCTQILYRVGKDTKFQPTKPKRGGNIDGRTGQPFPNYRFDFQEPAEPTTVSVQYVDGRGELQGPFDYDFDPAARRTELALAELKAAPRRWVRFKADGTIHFDCLKHGRAIDSIRYSLDDQSLDRMHSVPTADERQMGENALHLQAPNVDFVAIQLEYVDGTESKIETIKRRRN